MSELNKIGFILAKERQLRGLSIEEVSKKIMVRSKYLVAIEDNIDTPDLPPGVFMLGYLKIYAEFLKLDVNNLLYQIRTNSNLATQDFNIPETHLIKSAPSKVTVLISLVLTIIIYTSWYHLNYKYKDLLDKNRFISEVLQEITNKEKYDILYSSNNIKKNSFLNHYTSHGSNEEIKKVLVLANNKSILKVIDSSNHMINKKELDLGEVLLLSLTTGSYLTAGTDNSLIIYDKLPNIF